MSALLALAALLPLPAQNYVAPGQPITFVSTDYGVFNWATRTWVPPDRAARLRAGSTTVYNNTCTWTTANYFVAVPMCTTFFDEGRIPSTSDPAHPLGATDDNLIDSFDIAYCTTNANGTIDVKIGFYANWGGCLSGLAGTPWTPPLANNATAYFDFGAVAGFPLPGDPVPGGAYQCNRVTIALGNLAFCMASDGEGTWDNQARLDAFAWSIESNTQPNGAALGFNPIMAGDPSLSPANGCTYSVPCGSDPSPSFAPVPYPCGHGLDTEDHWWMNVDGGPWGGGGPTCTGSPGAGSNCYWFGGYPGNPFASYWLVLGSAGSCSGCAGSPATYCTAGTSTAGCTALLTLTGTPSISNAGPCNVVANTVEGQKNGMIFYGLTQYTQQWGASGTSFLCIKAPTQRTAPQFAGGTAGQCDGTLATDINQFFASNPGAYGQPLTVGQVLYFQAWYRDPPQQKTTSLSNGLTLSMCP